MITMPFGKHRGKPLSDIPEDYLRWCLANVQRLTPALRRAIKAQLAMQSETPKSTTNITTNIADTWYRKLAVEFHPDRGGTHEAMKAVNRGRELLLQLTEGCNQ